MSLASEANRDADVNPSALEEIRFDYKTGVYFAILALYLLITTCAGINGSSVGRWEHVFGRSPATNLLGSAKAVRSDEWVIHTPAILSQCNSSPRFPTENYSLGAFKAPLLMNVPVKHFSSVLRPQFWLFFVADIDRGFAFYWSMKAVYLLSGAFLLLMLILRNNFTLSVLGSLWLFSSGYIQWWYSSPQMWPELIGSFALLTVSLGEIMISRSKLTVVLFSLLFIVAGFNFIVPLYPPHQVTLASLGGVLLVGMFAPRLRPLFAEFSRNRFAQCCLLIALAISALLLFLYYSDARQALDALDNTVYPGKRRSFGGDGSLSEIFDGFVGLFMTEENFPKPSRNICESSNFFLFFPVPAMLLCWDALVKKKVALLEGLLACYIALLLIWSLFGFPAIIAKFSLFDRVAWPRAVLPLGVASILWTCLFCHKLTRENIAYPLRSRMFVTGIIGAAFFLHALNFRSAAPFLSTTQIILVTAFVSLTCWLLIAGRAVWFMLALVVADVLAFGLVNPVRVGLKPVTGNNLYSSIRKAAAEEPEAKWVVYGNPALANLAYAAGAKVFNGLKYVPELSALRKLSDKPEDFAVYNRYGFITVSATTGPAVRFEWEGIEDSYTLFADPHNDCWRQLGINYVAIQEKDGLTLLRSDSH